MSTDPMDISGQPPTYPPNLLGIPTELQLRIVDHITLKSDLASLCRTCSALRVLANPLLYRRIVLRLWSQRAVDRLNKSNFAGAGLHYQHTKEVIIEDEAIGEELYTIHTGRICPPILDRRSNATYLTESEKDNAAYAFLQTMHHNQLERLWYHSRRPLSAVVRNHLRHYQTKIQDLRIGLYTDPGSPDVLPQILCGLQRLDLYVDNSTSLILLYMNIEAVGANLKSLSLTAANSMDISTELDAWAMGEENEYTQCTPKLEEFTLSNFIYDNAYEQFSIIVNYHQLVRLGLFGNSGGTHYFLQELAESSEENKLRLKHIAVEIAGDIAESTELVPLRLSLNQIYKACEPLESFHIHYPHGDHSSDFDVYDFLKPFTDRGHNLQSLSYHVEQWNWGQLNHDVIDVLYRVSQESFRQVKQLAVYFEEALMLDGLWNEEARFMIFMTWIGYFREVRLLHLRVPHCVRMGQSKHGWDPALLILQLQTFANRVFEFLGPESKLDALVIGHVSTLRNPENLDRVRPLPQQCFLRGEQRDILGRTVPVAVPVTRMMLRETQPYTDILEVDYRTAADEWEAWATRTM